MPLLFWSILVGVPLIAATLWHAHVSFSRTPDVRHPEEIAWDTRFWFWLLTPLLLIVLLGWLFWPAETFGEGIEIAALSALAVILSVAALQQDRIYAETIPFPRERHVARWGNVGELALFLVFLGILGIDFSSLPLASEMLLLFDIKVLLVLAWLNLTAWQRRARARAQREAGVIDLEALKHSME